MRAGFTIDRKERISTSCRMSAKHSSLTRRSSTRAWRPRKVTPTKPLRSFPASQRTAFLSSVPSARAFREPTERHEVHPRQLRQHRRDGSPHRGIDSLFFRGAIDSGILIDAGNDGHLLCLCIARLHTLFAVCNAIHEEQPASRIGSGHGVKSTHVADGFLAIDPGPFPPPPRHFPAPGAPPQETGDTPRGSEK